MAACVATAAGVPACARNRSIFSLSRLTSFVLRCPLVARGEVPPQITHTEALGPRQGDRGPCRRR